MNFFSFQVSVDISVGSFAKPNCVYVVTFVSSKLKIFFAITVQQCQTIIETFNSAFLKIFTNISCIMFECSCMKFSLPVCSCHFVAKFLNRFSCSLIRA